MFKKILITVIQVALIILFLFLAFYGVNSISWAEELTEAYVLCQPDDYINVRVKPSRRSDAIGYLEAGDYFLTDGTVKNGYLKCYGIGEMGDGWIYKGYVVYDEPVEVNRIGCSISKFKLAARKYIGGKVRKWIRNLEEFMVYLMSDEWCVTSKGFIKTIFVELDGV